MLRGRPHIGCGLRALTICATARAKKSTHLLRNSGETKMTLQASEDQGCAGSRQRRFLRARGSRKCLSGSATRLHLRFRFYSEVRHTLPRRRPSSYPPTYTGANERLLDRLNQPVLAREIRAKLTESGLPRRHSKSRDFRPPCIHRINNEATLSIRRNNNEARLGGSKFGTRRHDQACCS